MFLFYCIQSNDSTKEIRRFIIINKILIRNNNNKSNIYNSSNLQDYKD